MSHFQDKGFKPYKKAPCPGSLIHSASLPRLILAGQQGKSNHTAAHETTLSVLFCRSVSLLYDCAEARFSVHALFP